MADNYTVSGYEGDDYIRFQKPNSWRWEGETAIHLPDGRVFANLADARAANGPQWVEIRVPVAGVQQVDRDFVRGLYLTYLRREPDASGWDFWTNELTTGRNTRAGIERAFAADAVPAVANVPVTTVVTPVGSGRVPVVTTTVGGLLDGTIFGIDKKLALVGAVALYFLTAGKGK